MNQVLSSVGAGVTWRDITAVLPQTRTTQTSTATAGQTTFSFTYNVNYLDVFVNGVKLSSSELTATNGTSVVISEASSREILLNSILMQLLVLEQALFLVLMICPMLLCQVHQITTFSFTTDQHSLINSLLTFPVILLQQILLCPVT